MRFEEGFVDMAQEYKIYFSMKNIMLPKDPVSAELQKSASLENRVVFYSNLIINIQYRAKIVINNVDACLSADRETTYGF